jgi:hypothetical protein
MFPIASLTNLKELYFRGNNISVLPEGLFANLTALTKLRMLGNPIMEPLPSYIYHRNSNSSSNSSGGGGATFDCDVPEGLSPQVALEMSRPAPTWSPTAAPSPPELGNVTEFSPTRPPTKPPQDATSSAVRCGEARSMTVSAMIVCLCMVLIAMDVLAVQ